MEADGTGTPDGLLYSPEHTWASGDRDLVRIGVTDFAQDALGTVVFVAAPEVGATVVAGEPMGEVESAKSVSDVVAPLSGTVEAVNDRLDETPELVNTNPYDEGWIAVVRPTADDWREGLLSSEGYRERTAGGGPTAP